MATSFVTPNMNLTVPVPSQEPGPQWASDLNNSLGVIDGHTHAPGSGVQITPSGININAALPFNSNQATGLAFVNITAQGGSVPAPTNYSLYASGVDLFYQDGSGNAVQITLGGNVNATSSGISSGSASASFVSSVLTVTQSAGVGAAIDAASYILRYNGSYPSPSGNYIVLAAPSGLSGGYQFTFPATTPAANSFLAIDNSGNVSATVAVTAGINTANLANGAVTRPKLSALGQQVSSSCGNFNTGSTVFPSFVNVTNLSVTLTTTGRPVVVFLQPDGVGNPAFISAGSSSTAIFQITRDSTVVYQSESGVSSGPIPPSVFMIDTGASAASHTYTFQATRVGTQAAAVAYCVLVAYET